LKTDPTYIEMNDDRLFSEVFTIHFNSLYNYGMKISRNRELVEDCIQELFFRIWKNNINLKAISNPKSYLLKGLRHQIMNTIALKNNHPEKADILETITIEFSHEDLYIQNQSEEEIRKKVLSAINRLSEKQREAIYLRYFEELSYEEIAQIMTINLQSAKNDVQRGIKTLREYLGVISMVFVLNVI
jgi:RNA polymerase sigma factor (sigma-70 family)